MKFKTKINLLIIIFTASLSGCSPGNKDASGNENELREALTKFNQAFAEGDHQTLESMITDNYIHTNSKSKPIRKTDWVNYLVKRKQQLSSRELVIQDYKMSDIEIEMYGEVAIVMAQISFTSIRSEEEKENEFRITNIWVKDEGSWKRAGFHDTRIK